MSSKLHGQVWECEIQPISRKAVLARLADFSSDEGYSWPAVDTIRRQVGAKSKNTVTAAIKELEKDGWLQVIPRTSGGRTISNAYQLNVDKIETTATDARLSAKAERKSKSAKSEASKINPPNINHPNSDQSKIEGSKNDELGGQKLVGEGSTIDPDPLIDPITDPSDKTSCQVAAQPDGINPDPAVQVLEHFNRVTNSSYGLGGRTKTTLGYIRGRMADNYSAEDLILVVDYLTAKWADDPKMSEYLRPRTLFAPENCVEYFEKASKWHASGRPKCVKGRWVKDDAAFKATHGQVDYSLPDNAGFRT